MDSYWTSVLQHRLNRRRALAAGSAGFAGAALLAACGGGGDDSGGRSGSRDKAGMLASPVDPTKQAVAGGVWTTAVDMESINVDPIAQTTSIGFNFTMMVYSKLAKYGLSKKPNVLPTTKEITGDAAESWEITPDATQITLKLRQNHKFDPRPPTNGRAMTVDDVKWSWDRFSSLSAFRGDLLNSLSEAGIVDSVSFPDARTIVIKMAYSYGQLLDIVAYYPYFNIMPVEAEKGFDPPARRCAAPAPSAWRSTRPACTTSTRRTATGTSRTGRSWTA
jgi:ABC-type transport system substrate-binding protein